MKLLTIILDIMEWNWKKIGIISGCVAGALLVIYFGFSFYFMNHFYFFSTVNGANSSGAGVETVKERLEELASGYSLTISEEDGETEEITSEEVSLTLSVEDGQIEGLLEEQSGFGWIGALFHHVNYVSESVASVDDEQLIEAVSSLDVVTKEAATVTTDATYAYEDGQFVIVDEVYGTNVDATEFAERVKTAMVCFDTDLDMEADSCYVQPSVTADSKELQELVEELNKRLDMTISYTLGSTTETIDAETMAGFLSADEELNLSVNTEALSEFVSSMGKKYNTYGQSKTLATTWGTTVTVPGGNYGWKIDSDGEVAQLTEDILAGEDVSRDFVYQYTANSHDGNDYGNSYVEINLTAQYLYLYVNGTLVVESAFVSGNPSKGNATPTGAYQVTYTEKDATLNGDNYSTPVSYWMPFNGNVGMHDATWRSNFGGSIYLTNGSHGCINLPLSVAKTIYENISAGFCVLVYELPGTETYSYDKTGVDNVINLINAIGDVSTASADAISAARTAYDALDATSQTFVTNIDTLTAAETTLADLQAQEAAANVVNLINAIGEVTTASGETISQAEAAYNALSDQAKAYVSNFATLAQARATYDSLPK